MAEGSGHWVFKTLLEGCHLLLRGWDPRRTLNTVAFTSEHPTKEGAVAETRETRSTSSVSRITRLEGGKGVI